jgi:hypothetical protein
MFLIVFVVLYSIFILVFLNNFVTILVSGPQYVEVVHFVFCVSCEILVGCLCLLSDDGDWAGLEMLTSVLSWCRS